MVLFYDPLSKGETMEWRQSDERLSRNAVQSMKEMMITIFCDCENILLTDFKERHTTVNGTVYRTVPCKT